jgi:hypothetical protein
MNWQSGSLGRKPGWRPATLALQMPVDLGRAVSLDSSYSETADTRLLTARRTSLQVTTEMVKTTRGDVAVGAANIGAGTVTRNERDPG